MSSKELKVYHSQWGIYERDFWVDDIPDYLGVIYSFWDITSDKLSRHPLVPDDVIIGKNKVVTRDMWGDQEAPKGKIWGGTNQFQMMKTKTGKGIATELSQGGWSFSRYFSDACLTESSRNVFVGSIIDTFKKHPGVFSGVSLDWEYPSDKGESIGYGDNITRVGDGDRFILTCKLLREQLNANGFSNFPISGFLSADPNKLEGHLKVGELSKYMDELHVQGYDFADGNWGETKSSHQCNLYPKPGVTKFSCHETIQYYLSKGVPSKQIHIGVAAYSRGHGNTGGFGQPSSGGANKNWSWEEGILDYRHIINGGTGIGNRVVTKSPVEPTWDEDMQAHYWYDPASRELISCDTPRSVEAKAKYAFDNKLGGMFIWESSGDVRDHTSKDSLMKAVKDSWKTPGDDPIEEEPPKEDPIQEEPPKEDPIQEEPPKEDPIQEEPPKEEPVDDDPPYEEPPYEDPPYEEPVDESTPFWKFLLLGLVVGVGVAKLLEKD